MYRIPYGRRLTIRSSGPLRRAPLLSCGARQRPLNSSVRPHVWHIALFGSRNCRASGAGCAFSPHSVPARRLLLASTAMQHLSLFLGSPHCFSPAPIGQTYNFFSHFLLARPLASGSFLCFSAGLAKLLGSPASDAVGLTTCVWGAGLGALVAGCFGAIAGLHNLRASAAAEA